MDHGFVQNVGHVVDVGGFAATGGTVEQEGRLDLLLATDLFRGRTGERRLDRWEAAFLPRVLREIVAEARVGGAPLAGPTEVVYHRQTRSPFAGHDPLAGVKLLWLCAALGVGLALLLVLGSRRRIRWAGLAVVPLALTSGLGGALVWVVVGLATLPDLRLNEICLSLWPLDLLLLWPAVRWVRGRLWAGRLLRGYLLLRLLALGGVLLGHISGLLVQQPRAWLVISAALILGTHVATRSMGHKASSASGPLQGA